MLYSLRDFVKIDRRILKMGTITCVYKEINAYQVMCAQTMKFYTIEKKEIKEVISGEKLNKLIKSKSLFLPPESLYRERKE